MDERDERRGRRRKDLAGGEGRGMERAKTIMSFPHPCQSASQSMRHSVS